MKVILRRTLSERKGWVEGAVMDWPRPTITAMSQQLGGDDWYAFADKIVRRSNQRAMRGPGRPRKEDVEE